MYLNFGDSVSYYKDSDCVIVSVAGKRKITDQFQASKTDLNFG